jgi:predicted ATPase/class 3 adenylate cyclase
MVEPPKGAITLLFSDIEGSTQLLQRTGDLYPDLLADHRRILRTAFASHDGYEVDSEGDAFFVVFPSANDAIAAASDGQRALAEHSWRDGHDVRVRMGVHSGEPRLVDGKYVGLDVHRAARVMASGHGGQVILSHAARAGLDKEWPVVDLGEHRLKDLLQPERLYQLVIDGLPSDFPALKTLGNRPTNLPTQPNELVGREAEVGAITNLLRNAGPRLVTLTGPGGTGKTRLALQVGAELLEEFRSGVFFVSLAPVADEDQVIPAIAETLAVREAAGEDLADTLRTYLSEKAMLLVLDNLEHVIGAAPRITELLEAADLRMLVTSRERLHLAAEHVYEVPPLVLPGSDQRNLATLLENDAVALFTARAQAADPSFRLTADNAADVVAICRALDGLPLALELAAARIPVLSPQALLTRLDKRLSLLTGGARDADKRQRTLRGALEWSHDLLDPSEQTLFARLAVFVDGCRLDAAENVCRPSNGVAGLDTLQSLVDKSLVRQRADPDGERRFWMLETIREYAGERLAEREEDGLLAQRHADYFLELAEQAEPALWAGRTEEWLPRLEVEQPNFRAALEHWFGADDAELALRLAGALYPFWEIRGQHSEAHTWLMRTLALDGDVSLAYRIKGLIGAGRASGWGFEWRAMAECLEEAVELSRQVGDVEGIGRCLGFIGHLRLFTGDREGAAAVLGEALDLARKSGDRHSVARALHNAAAAAVEERDFARAREMYEEAIAIARAEGLGVALSSSATQLGWLAILEHDYERAARQLHDAVRQLEEVGEKLWAPIAQRYVALLKLLQGEIGDAEVILRQSLTGGREQAPAWQLVYWVEGFAAVATAKGESARAARLWGATDGLWQRFGLAVSEESRQVRERFRPEIIPDSPQYEAWAQARAMTLDEALAYALSEETTERDEGR